MWVHYIPIATTLIAATFAFSLFRRYAARPNIRLLWWAIGVSSYGLGALLEGCITLFGNTIWLTKAWYVAGAILGGYPLAQGSLYLAYSRRFANRATAISLPIVVITSILVFLSPALPANMELTRPSGAILGWKWVRLMTPFINSYAMFFLIGVAATSSWRYFHSRHSKNRAVGNAMIAMGALMPGIETRRPSRGWSLCATARRSASLARSRSGGSPQIPGPVIRIAPKPSRFTVRSPPTSILPAAAAVGLPFMTAPSAAYPAIQSASVRPAARASRDWLVHGSVPVSSVRREPGPAAGQDQLA